ncbi:hypothetical protein RIF29_17640 [Crotalaria pallida]|uniref:Alpha-galactosidase n=1 Tax=Crotalaria pallida TaxID=3830 RepID=A0AAN9FIG5_CROPI
MAKIKPLISWLKLGLVVPDHHFTGFSRRVTQKKKRMSSNVTMKFLSVISLCFLLCLYVRRVSSQNAITPPRGWNSYDSFSWVISEEEYLQNAQIISDQLLKEYGYEYAVVDYLWYRKLDGDSNSRGFDVIDEWGRMHPDPERWPSSIGWKGFKDVADKVHNMGLKFGIHLMAGISTQAYDANTPILDTTTGRAYEESGQVWHARDIGYPERSCKWMSNGFMPINTISGAGQAFLRSIYELYTSWGVDFVKLDCVFAQDLDYNEIHYVSQLLNELNPSIVFSVSPGVDATSVQAKPVSGLVNTYRVTGDDWDKWKQVVAHFDVARDFAAANLIGAPGLNGKSWPDLDMLPFGWLTDPAVKKGPHRLTKLTPEEQQTQMTLWCMAKSPIMYGGDLRHLESWKDSVIFPYITRIDTVKRGRKLGNIKAQGSADAGLRAWIATGNNGGQSPLGEDIYIAFFNLNDEAATMSANLDDLGTVLRGRQLRGLRGREAWTSSTVVLDDTLSMEVSGHGCTLFVFNY